MNARFAVAPALLSAAALSLVTVQALQPQAVGGRRVPDELIVKFKPGVSDFQRAGVLNARSAQLIRRFSALDVDHVRLNRGQDLAAALAAFRSSPSVALVQPNYTRRIVGSAPPNDPYWTFGLMWGMERIQAQTVWTNFTHGSPDVIVADIDTGVDYNHPDLAANMWVNPGEIPGNGVDDDANGYVDDVYGIDTINHDSDPMDDHGHGTHTTGTIGAIGDNGIGVVGVAWGTRLLACKFLDSAGHGEDSGAIECLNYVVALKQRGVNIRVSSNSWGEAREGAPAEVLKAAVDQAGAAGILNVFAAGNDGLNNDQRPFDPASFDSPNLIAVAASTSADDRASFSNYGATSVDIAAPGDLILSTAGGSYSFSSGTSMAAPHVAGAAALLFSKDPSLSADSAKTVLMQTVDVLPQWAGVVVSGGRLNVSTAATAVAGGNLAPSVTITSPVDGAAVPIGSTVPLQAMASDTDGQVYQVEFLVNGATVGTVTTSVGNLWSTTWTTAMAGIYTVTAVATDDDGATRISNPVTFLVSPPPGRVNVALAANGGTAVASSSDLPSFPTGGVINGDRKGLQWGTGGGWQDDTANAWPDWLEVRFASPQSIEEIDVFTVQDNYAAPSEPTVSMPFTKYGVQDFVVEYWTGSAWAAVPGGTVTNNTRVWRQFNFTPLTTSKIRVSVSRGMASRSRLVEVEAYAVFGSVNQAPEVTVTSPPDGAAVPTGAAVSLEATASDADGTVSRVDFQVNGTAVGTDTTAVGGVFTTTWTPSLAGSYTVTAVATDDDGATRTSNPVAVVVTPPPGRVNVALAANGGTAVASSTDSSSFPTIGAINGDRKGLQWGSGGGWQDGTANAWPDWLEVRFDAARTIEEVDVFTVQDNYAAPLEPTVSMTFTKYGVQDFVVEYWTGSAWALVPGGTVTNNTRVWRQFSFTPLTTSKIRVSVTRALASRTRLVEVEAYAVSGTVNLAPTVTLTSPANNASVPVGAVVPLEATASDADGTVSKVDFLVNGATVGTDTSAAGAVFTATWTAALAGSYTVTAVATDDDGATRTSNPVTVVVTPPAGRVNVALATNGGTAVASSTDSTGAFPTSGVINGDRKGLQWGSGGGWQDGTAAVWPDWLEVRFDGARTIEEIDVFTVQDNYAAPLEPTLTMTFTKYGLQDFVVEHWTGSAWAPVPGATVTNNNRVWRQFNFTPLTTSKIRVSVTRALASRSRVVEVEAFTTIGG